MYNTSPYLDIVQLYSSKNIFLTNSVETRTDRDQLVCQKPAGLDLFRFEDKISVKNIQSGRVLPRECWHLFR